MCCSLSFIVMAAMSVANIVKTSLGPVGLDKMLVDEIGVSERRFVCSCVYVCVYACDRKGHSVCACGY